MPLNLVALSRIKNEIDIVEAFVRHTAALVDAHLILDNGSTDGTSDIFKALAGEGVAIEVVRDSEVGGEDEAILTAMMRRALSAFSADWVLPLDVDEFIGANGRDHLEAELGASPHPALVAWRTYTPVPADDPLETNPVLRIRHRLQTESAVWEKVLVPAEWAEQGVLTPGHHDIQMSNRADTRRTRLGSIRLCHFPVRNLSQYAIKVLMGNLWYVARGPERNGLGFHYLAPFRQLLDDWDGFCASFYDAAPRFALEPGATFDPVLVEDPFRYLGSPLRFTPPPRHNEPWRTMLEYSLQLAEQIGRTGTRGE